ncbi:iron chelate uptake ABC transporter family permease subunit, partial [Deltaproteobacteria bacterium OttesenSCG-928-M10]|nr:iron chelate uptake ABC transporter family permease subunit [Deltaproteobacteria bacterium OttesenSCG-928-M10]
MTSKYAKILTLILISLGIVLLSPLFGISTIDFEAIWQKGNPDGEVFWMLRVPRTVAAFLAGAGLSMS